jgi:uncharacterized protein
MNTLIKTNPRKEEAKPTAQPCVTLGSIAVRLHHTSSEERIFGSSLAVLAVHLADAAVEGQSFGNASSPLASLAAIALLPALFTLFLWRGRGVRTVLAAALGLMAVFFGIAVNVAHILIAGVGGRDYTGILFTVAGIVLIGLALRIGLRGRRPLIQVAALLLALFVIIQWVVEPAKQAGIATNAPRSASPSASTLGVPGATDVTFLARDGVRLVGWYVPGQNDAAVILLHGSHVTRDSTVQHLRVLAQAGYAVLAYDARGHGQSDGQTSTFGWIEDNDIAGAVNFLRHQPGVNPGRIAALGLSMGAMDALRASANGVPLGAVIADGAGATTFGDMALTIGQGYMAPLALSANWLSMRATELISGLTEPPSLESIVGNIRVPVLLIASNNIWGELADDQVYRDRIGKTATLWYVPDAGHTEALNMHPQDYTVRVTTFLKAALYHNN